MSFTRQLVEKNRDLWEACYQHPFVQELGRGSLPVETFKFYLLQDYLYLFSYAKVFALAALKSDDEELLTRFTGIQFEILSKEMAMHRAYMTGFGISKDDMAQVQPALFNKTYTAYMLSVGETGGLPEIMAAVLPCAVTYADFAARLRAAFAHNLAENPYRDWIAAYVSEDYINLVDWLRALTDKLAGKHAAVAGRMESIFRDSLEFEYLFWDMAYTGRLSIVPAPI